MKMFAGASAAIAEWEQLFAAAKRSISKVEMLQDYSIIDDGPSLQAWLAGDRAKARQLAEEQMSDWLAQRNEGSANVTRFRITEEPNTPYLEWEIECLYSIYEQTKTEQVHLIARSAIDTSNLPNADFWLFDETTALQWIFGPQNRTEGAMVTESVDEVTWYRQAIAQLAVFVGETPNTVM